MKISLRSFLPVRVSVAHASARVAYDRAALPHGRAIDTSPA